MVPSSVRNAEEGATFTLQCIITLLRVLPTKQSELLISIEVEIKNNKYLFRRLESPRTMTRS